jgi:hypothetical protein
MYGVLPCILVPSETRWHHLLLVVRKEMSWLSSKRLATSCNSLLRGPTMILDRQRQTVSSTHAHTRTRARTHTHTHARTHLHRMISRDHRKTGPSYRNHQRVTRNRPHESLSAQTFAHPTGQSCMLSNIFRISHET